MWCYSSNQLHENHGHSDGQGPSSLNVVHNCWSHTDLKSKDSDRPACAPGRLSGTFVAVQPYTWTAPSLRWWLRRPTKGCIQHGATRLQMSSEVTSAGACTAHQQSCCSVAEHVCVRLDASCIFANARVHHDIVEHMFDV